MVESRSEGREEEFRNDLPQNLSGGFEARIESEESASFDKKGKKGKSEEGSYRPRVRKGGIVISG